MRKFVNLSFDVTLFILNQLLFFHEIEKSIVIVTETYFLIGNQSFDFVNVFSDNYQCSSVV